MKERNYIVYKLWQNIMKQLSFFFQKVGQIDYYKLILIFKPLWPDLAMNLIKKIEKDEYLLKGL